MILFDAPESFAQHIVKAVAEVTRESIVQLVYSHAHLARCSPMANGASDHPAWTIFGVTKSRQVSASVIPLLWTGSLDITDFLYLLATIWP